MRRIMLSAAIAAVFAASSAHAADTKVIVERGGEAPKGFQLLADYGGFALYRGPAERSAGAKALDDADVLQFDRLRLDTQTDTIHAPPGFALREPTGAALQVVQFVGPLRDEWLATVRATGALPVHYVASFGYLVWADAAARDRLDQLATQRDVLQFSAPLPSFAKLDTALAARFGADGTATAGDEPMDVVVQLVRHPGADSKPAIAALGAKAQTRWEPVMGFENAKLTATLAQVREIIELPDVYWVGQVHPRERNDEVQDQIVAGHLASGNAQPTGPGYLAWLAGKGFPTTPASYPVLDVTDDGLGDGTTTGTLSDATLYQLGSTANPTRILYNQSCTAAGPGGVMGGHGHLNTNIAIGYDTRDNATRQFARYPATYQRALGINPWGRGGMTRIFTGTGSFDESACGNTDQGAIKKAQDAGAVISSNSWGCSGCAAQYDDSSQAYDVGVRDADGSEAGLQPMIYVFSAGNSGPNAGTLGTPGNGKNMITVGASENYRPDAETAAGTAAWSDGCGEGPTGADNAMDVIDFSSRGPAPGARRKPEVIAPGTHITGTRSQNYTTTLSQRGTCDAFSPLYADGTAGNPTATFAASSGTSHSAPAVAGVTTLAYWWIQQGQGGIQFQGGTPGAPSPALMKAWLMAHPTYLTGQFANDSLPSNSQGYGMPNLEQMFDASAKYVNDQKTVFAATGESFTWQGASADSSKPTRITLAYTDQAGAIGTSPQVNNLDLEVLLNGSTVYRGNVFTGAFGTAGGAADTANNYEAVFLPAGTGGALEIKVKATNIAGDGIPGNADTTDQDFALVCNNCSQTPTFTLGGAPADASICTPSQAGYSIDVGAILGFNAPVQLALSGNPAGTTPNFSVNPVTPGGNTQLTIGNTNAAAAGAYTMTLTGTAAGTDPRSRPLGLTVFTAAPVAPSLTAPADAATGQPQRPAFSWAASAQAATYVLEVDDNSDFSSILYTATVAGTSHTPGSDLPSNTQLYWRVRVQNECGSQVAASRTFTTQALPGDCPLGTTASPALVDDLEAGAAGWTHSGTGDTWALSAARSHSGTNAFLAQDVAIVSDQRLVSPPIVLPAGQTPVTLSFWNDQTFEDTTGGCFDGAILEVSTDGGTTWTQLTGAALLTDPYDGPVSAQYSNPLQNLNAWCGDPQAWTRSVVSLAAYAGQTVRLRFRVGTDTSVGRTPHGWYIDDIRVQSCAGGVGPPVDPLFSHGFE